MNWQRLQLTNEESKRWTVYSDPSKLQRPVLYRTYAGELNLNTTTPEDIENVQISRRARVMGLTASGDIHNMEISIYDSSGEQYTMNFAPLANLLMGLNVDPRGLALFKADEMFSGSNPKRLGLGMVHGSTFCLAPHIFEPNILLLPNQTLSVKGRALNPPSTLPKFNNANVNETAYEGQVHVSFNLHVWEFPIE